MKVSVIIPTRNAGTVLGALLSALFSQSRRADEILVLDSGSEDDTKEVASRAGASVYGIAVSEFNHGGTRNLAAAKTSGDLLVYFTQDSLPADSNAIEALCRCFEDKEVGAAYGRQLPKTDSGPLGAHARLFSYPDKSYVRSMSDAGRFGLKTAFLSNSFAAYRREALSAVGGFPEDTILAEDMCAAGRMLMSGWKVAYCAEAKVYHSHDYGIFEEFRRYFDIGVFHSREIWLRKQFGKAEGEGGRFVKSEITYLLANSPLMVPYAVVKTFFKYAGYRLGIMHELLPLSLKRSLSMHRKYWDQVRKV